MPISSRKYTLDELIAEFRDTIASEGRTICPVTAYLESHRDDWTLDDAEHWLSTDLNYGPPTCADIIRTAGTHNTPEVTAEVQRLYAGYLSGFPWSLTRFYVEKLLHADIPHGIDPQALIILLNYVKNNHPNPKALLSKHEVMSRLPIGIDLTHEKSPDFPELARTEIRGRGMRHPKGVEEAFVPK